ncbi:c-Myc-binding protein-like [Xenia sp. Carnegie-2017]|uniref:c-Myc-binding protein-like n=1 Tax=Xenia sp. Carnegie-2017 TaxID=2897299 RepID=UPI001F04BC35|nr:c-Myc-binding protein-like [Xenia sp. Carnegie-2017]
MNQTQYKVADSKREEFRKYLEKAGVLDALTKVLVSLYEEPEKPSNALDYLGAFLHGGPPQTADVQDLKLNVEQLQQMNAQLTKENEELRLKLQQYEPTGDDQGASET